MPTSRTICGLLLALSLSLVACEKSAPQSPVVEPSSAGQVSGLTPKSADDSANAPAQIEFTDITTQAGISFKHHNGGFGKKYFPETMGSGCAFLDYDNDDWQDILLVNSMDWPEHRSGKSPLALYHNNQDGTFTDATTQAGLASEMYGMGVAVGDYDNDGNVDVYLTCVGNNHLFRNLGTGRFADVTAKAGLRDPGFSTSAAWFDYDNDGQLDLFVCHYVDWSIEKDQYCSLTGKNKSYCTPQAYKGQSSTLYHNKGHGTFENVTERAGLLDETSKSLGVALLDYNHDGQTDLFVANDTEPNKLYKNNGDGTFTDQAVMAGVAYNESGTARAGMGVDAGDYDNSGRQGLVVGNFTNESIALYHNDETGFFTNEANNSGIEKMSANSLTFACFFFDYDLDGRLDVFAANGHIADDISLIQPRTRYAQPPHLFRNQGQRQFAEMTSQVGGALQQAVVGRGAAYGDIDHDGDLDLLLTANNEAARLLRNDNGNRNDFLRVKTIGAKSNRDGIGAQVTLKTSQGATLLRVVKSGSSYCSQSELPLTFGLGKFVAGTVMSLDIIWPSGQRDSIKNLSPRQSITIQEGKGVASANPLN